MLVDTHCHLGDERFDTDRASVLERARGAGVGHVIIIADTAPATGIAITLAERFQLSATAGVHPHEASSWCDAVGQTIAEALEHPAVVAVGEAGLDYHYDHSPRDVQRKVFQSQLELAARYRLPIVVHSRSADADIVPMLRYTEAPVVLHSFSSGPEVLALAVERSFYLSFSGMVTFRSWRDDEAVRAVAEDRLLIETDAPYLAPVPHRGKRNEPAYVRRVAEGVARIRGTSVAELEEITTANAIRCFGSRVSRHTE